MLRLDSKSLNFSGASLINEEVAANMHASYTGGAEIYINMNVTNIDLYNANKDAVDADFAAFSDEVMAVIAVMDTTPITPANIV